ncbi:hypothetical protein DIPPA_31496 [Diplonema papillatum]|nr:hypothetical protein DIPPA_31496 [Diplonema papillatum]
MGCSVGVPRQQVHTERSRSEFDPVVKSGGKARAGDEPGPKGKKRKKRAKKSSEKQPSKATKRTKQKPAGRKRDPATNHHHPHNNKTPRADPMEDSDAKVKCILTVDRTFDLSAPNTVSAEKISRIEAWLRVRGTAFDLRCPQEMAEKPDPSPCASTSGVAADSIHLRKVSAAELSALLVASTDTPKTGSAQVKIDDDNGTRDITWSELESLEATT